MLFDVFALIVMLFIIFRLFCFVGGVFALVVVWLGGGRLIVLVALWFYDCVV